MPLQLSQDDLDFQFSNTMEEKLQLLHRFLAELCDELERRFDYKEAEEMIRENVVDPYIYQLMMNEIRVRWGISPGARLEYPSV
jgi:hypothetical protein